MIITTQRCASVYCIVFIAHNGTLCVNIFQFIISYNKFPVLHFQWSPFLVDGLGRHATANTTPSGPCCHFCNTVCRVRIQLWSSRESQVITLTIAQSLRRIDGQLRGKARTVRRWIGVPRIRSHVVTASPAELHCHRRRLLDLASHAPDTT